MKKCIILIIATFLTFVRLFAQSNPTFQNLINVGTTAPEAASLGKFGNVPVGYNTGTPSISIPVYQIGIGKMKLPISLDYHAGGIRVDEISSSVGIGWALNGVGILSRNMITLPDEGSGGYLASPSFDSVYADWAAGGGYGAATDLQYSEYLYGVRQGTNESDPDIFSYSLANSSGKFIFKKDHSIMQIPHSNNQIIQVGANYEIIDDMGTVYVFDQVEHTQHPNAMLNYVSSWHLSKMIDPSTADTIYFTYQTACGINTETYINYTYTFGYGPDCSGNESPTAIDYQGEKSSQSTIMHPDELFLSQISWRGGKIVFNNACDRLDKASEQRLNEIYVYALVKGNYQLVKMIKPYQSYFYSNVVPNYAATDERNYRLRLDSVGFLPVATGAQPDMYRMTYTTSVPMASRQSPAQDQWGFNNGQFSNTTSMPKQTVLYQTGYYNIGEANRNTDSLSMLSCTIRSIQYPTGGKSVFAFEPHQYPTYQNYVVNKSVSCAAYGSLQSSSTITFTPDSLGSNYLITYNFSSYNYTDMTGRPNITITDQVTGQQIFISSNINPSLPLNNSSTPSSFSPILGHTYTIVVNIYTLTDPNVTASVTIGWVDTYTNVYVVGTGGGLRVKSITNFDNNGNFINEDTYQYGFGGSGQGQLLTPATYLEVYNESTIFHCGAPGYGVLCKYYQQNPPSSVIYHANPVYPATQFSGSPVLYNYVTKTQVNSAGAQPNGKSVFQYSIFDDQPAFASTDYPKVGVMLISEGWRNSYLGEQDDSIYNSSTSTYSILHKKINNYQAVRLDTMMGLKVKNLYNWATSQCYINNLANAINEYLLVRIPTTSGAMLLQSTQDITWDAYGHAVASVQNFTYGDLTHLYPTTRQSFGSKGESLVENIRYPHDFATSGNVYQTMLNRNIISPVVQDVKLNNGVQTELTNINYFDWFSNGTLLLPQTVAVQTASNPLETRIQFNAFDKYGNILQQQKLNDVFQSYIWDYQSVYPIATCVNAAPVDIGYTSFEADGSGNWTIPSLLRDTLNAITGTSSYNLTNGAVSKQGLTIGKIYLVTYWSKGGNYSILGGSSSYRSGRTVNGWTYYEHTITATSSAISLSGSNDIDELRIFPQGAMMTTYTYSPLVGMVSKADPNSEITYYEYDGLSRLKNIKDYNGNIIKNYQYNYANACANCGTLVMQTFNGSNTRSYPVGVFNVNGKLLGNATTQAQYISIWNADTADNHRATLSAGVDSMHFNFVAVTGAPFLNGLTGCRYYQYDLPYTRIDGIRSVNGEYVDFGDGTGMYLGKNPADTPKNAAPNTSFVQAYENLGYEVYAIHTYPDSSLKTLSFYHNDSTEMMWVDNANNPATSVSKLQNLRGNIPQRANMYGYSSCQQASAQTVANISNWNSINTITAFEINTGDGGKTTCQHVSFAQDFMQNNTNLQTIITAYTDTSICYYDTTFKISRLKSNWNTYFTSLQVLEICDDHWSRENLSSLLQLNFVNIVCGNQNHSNSLTGNTFTPIPSTAIDNIINQVAAGAGQSISNGIIWISSGGPTRTTASDASVALLKGKNWTINISGTPQ